MPRSGLRRKERKQLKASENSQSARINSFTTPYIGGGLSVRQEPPTVAFILRSSPRSLGGAPGRRMLLVEEPHHLC
jgi:hypothetical protein